MIRGGRAFMLCVIVLVGSCFGCVPPPPPQTIAVSPPPPPVRVMNCDKALFQSKILYETTPVMPTRGSTPPTTGDTFPSSPDYKGDLGTAFDAASDQFRARLCGLDGIYVQNSDSWGWQQKQNVTFGNGRIVAISASLWSGPPTYSQYETDLLRRVLPKQDAYYSNAMSCDNSVPPNCLSVDNMATKLLAVLAHEVGHIRWRDPALINHAQPGNFCGGLFYGSWKNPVHAQLRWRNLLTRNERDIVRGNGYWRDAHKGTPHIDTIDDDVDHGVDPSQLVADLFAPTQPWASGLAAISPDEDFVETYRFTVLTTARTPLTSVVATFPGTNPGSQNIPADYFSALTGANPAKQNLVDKVSCIPTSL